MPKKKKKKKTNKVIRLDHFRESEVEPEIEPEIQDLGKHTVQELEALRLKLQKQSDTWKMVMLKLVERYQQQNQRDDAWHCLQEVLEHIDVETHPKTSPSIADWDTTANIFAMLLAAGLRYEMKDFSETTGVRYWIDNTYQRIRRIEVQSGRGQPFPPEWKVYTRELMTMASLLRDDQRVMAIYQSLGRLCRGPAHHHLAGIAAFNLRQYNKARSSWKKMHQLDGEEEGMLYAKIAQLTEKSVIPIFTVDYQQESAFVHLRHQHMEEMEELVADGAKQQALKQVANEQLEELLHYVHEGVGWMSLLIDFYGDLADYLHNREPKSRVYHMTILLNLLILETDEWGVQLGRNLLKETEIPDVLKSEIEELLEEAAQEALASNVMDGKQPIQIYGDSYELVMEDQRAKAAYDQGQVLRDKGNPDAAKDHILRMLGKQKVITPNVILLLSALEKAMGQAEQAMVLLEELDAVLPGNMAILYNKVTAMMQLRKWQEALELLNQLREQVNSHEDLKEPFSAKHLERLEKKILKEMKVDRQMNATLRRGLRKMMGKSESERRKEIEEKDLPQKTTLRRGLKNMPMEWLKYTWWLHKRHEEGSGRKNSVKNLPKRAEMEKEISGYLLSSEGLKTVLNGLEPDEKELLDHLRERGGISPSGPVVRKFGSMEQDSYSLEKGTPPASTLGRLWSKGLVVVGRGLYKGKRQRVVLIPQDLLPLL